MKARMFVTAAVALAAFALPQNAAAQIGFGIGGGPSFPTGELAEDAGTGFNVQATLGLGVPLLPFGVRLDGILNQFPVGDETARILGGTVSAELYFPSPLISPYFVGGVGMYNTSIPHGNHVDEGTNFGLNAGLGVRLSLLVFNAYIETRAHHVLTDEHATQFIPLTIGLRF